MDLTMITLGRWETLVSVAVMRRERERESLTISAAEKKPDARFIIIRD